MKISSNKSVLGIAPILSIALLYFSMPSILQLPPEIIEKLPYTPYIIFTATIFFGIFFKRHRVTLAATCLSIVYLIIHNGSVAPELSPEYVAALTLAEVFLPINLVILAKTQDHQTLSIPALVGSAALLIQVLAGYWLAVNYTQSLNDGLFFIPDILSGILPLDISPAVAISYGASALWLTSHISKKGYIFEFAFIGALIASLFAFQASQQTASSLYMLLASLILIWGLVYNSYLIAYIDELTELPGRRAMNEEMAGLRGDYAIAMLDIDHFKKFNDSYGHDVGDQVLRMVASKIAKIRGCGKPFRYGGEEFAIIFHGKDSKAAFPFLSNLRETIDSSKMILRDHNRPSNKPENVTPRKTAWQEVHITISIGIANNCDELSTPTMVLKAADQALYRSKEKGRNRISQYSTNAYEPDLERSAVE